MTNRTHCVDAPNDAAKQDNDLGTRIGDRLGVSRGSSRKLNAPGTPIADLVSHSRSVTADADLDEIVRAMTDYDLTIVPVLDDDERPLGIITVDDVLEPVAPPPGRRFNIFGGA